MYHPTSRVLTVLELLQTHHQLSAAQIAARLEVDVRTVRRYIQQLQDMAIPIEAESGRYGGYRLHPGYKMPPLMLNSDEALAVALGLHIVQKMKLGISVSAIEGAAAKLARTLPEALRDELHALHTSVTLDLPVNGEVIAATLSTLNKAISNHQQVSLTYQNEQGQTTRLLNPYSVIYHAGRWYLVGYCHLREALRTFRVGSIQSVEMYQTIFVPPSDFDPLAFMLQSFAAIPDRWDIEIMLHTTLAEAQMVIPRQLASLESHAEGVLFRASMPDLHQMARMLMSYGFTMTVVRPVELSAAFHELAQEMLTM